MFGNKYVQFRIICSLFCGIIFHSLEVDPYSIQYEKCPVKHTNKINVLGHITYLITTFLGIRDQLTLSPPNVWGGVYLREMLPGYLEEYMWRERVGSDKFNAIITVNYAIVTEYPMA